MQVFIMRGLGLGLALFPALVMAEPGQGVRLGGVSLSPTVSAQLGYDNNPTRTSSTGTSLATPYLELKANVGTTYKIENVLKASLLAGLGYRYDFNDELDPRKPEYQLRLDGALFAERKLGFTFSNELQGVDRRAQGWNVTYYRLSNDLIGDVRYSPGSALELTLGGRWFSDLQDVSGDGVFQAPRLQQLGARTGARWRFFPRTALVFEGGYDHGNWSQLPACLNSSATATDCAAGTALPADDSTKTIDLWRVQGGVTGQVTTFIQANMFVGVGGLTNSDYDGAENISGLDRLLVQGAVVYSPVPTHAISLGYRRFFDTNPLDDFQQHNQAYFQYTGKFFDRLGATALMYYDRVYRDSGDVADAQTHIDRLLVPSLALDYKVLAWMNATLSYTPAFNFAIGTDPAEAFDNYSYSAQQFAIGVKGTY